MIPFPTVRNHLRKCQAKTVIRFQDSHARHLLDHFQTSRNDSARTKQINVATISACTIERRQEVLTDCLGKLFILPFVLAARGALLLVDVDLLFVKARLLLRRVGLLLVRCIPLLLARGFLLLCESRCVWQSDRGAYCGKKHALA